MRPRRLGNWHAVTVRSLAVVFGDQLDAASAVFDGFDPAQDAVLMMEVDAEATFVPQHKIRLALFFAAMRHFRDRLRAAGRAVHYSAIDDPGNGGSFAADLARRIAALKPQRLLAARPGDHRVAQVLRASAAAAGCRLEIREDRHFLLPVDEFRAFVDGRKRLLLETFYRMMRQRSGILMRGETPEGGRWNFDADNRETFGREGPGLIPPPLSFAPDPLTREVMALVERRFPHHPGRLQRFDYPVTAEQAQDALDDFIAHRLGAFGRYQDAMATGQPLLYHSRLSAPLNLHLLDPRTVLDAAVAAGKRGQAPLNSVEGFVRQILGWREYIRGVYWWQMPAYAELNALDATLPAPAFLWTAETEMNCIRQAVGQLIDHAYAHHIQRLMVLGLFCLLLGVRPYDVHRWHLSMFVDAIDWVSLPNVLGMSQFADGGLVATKPYIATGNYIDRMSDYCRSCRFDPRQATGERACPFTTLYWDFLERNGGRIKASRQMGYQLANLARKTASERQAIRAQATQIRTAATCRTFLK
jgi:deoxyribodipyrimidine photolyase-related protein